MFLSPLLRLEILIFIVAILVVFSISTLASNLGLVHYNLQQILIEIHLSYLLQYVFELFLAGNFKSATFEIKPLPHVVKFTGVELNTRAGSFVASYGEIIQLL